MEEKKALLDGLKEGRSYAELKQAAQDRNRWIIKWTMDLQLGRLLHDESRLHKQRAQDRQRANLLMFKVFYGLGLRLISKLSQLLSKSSSDYN